MKKWLRRLVTLSSSDRHLLVSTALLLGMIKLGLRILPFQSLRRLLAKSTYTTPAQNRNQVPVYRIVWAVEVVTRYMPGGVKCLARALATQVLLERHGHQAQLRIGVAKDEQGKLDAHAWVESQGRIVIGGLTDIARYTPFPTLEAKRL